MAPHAPDRAPPDRRPSGGIVILDSVNDVNWAAVGTSLVAAFAIGLVWFSPSVLGSFWARQVSRYAGIPESDVTSGASQATPLAKWLLVIAINAVVMALTVEAMGADSADDGVVLGLVLGIGFGVTLSSWPPIFARMPWQWWLVNSGAFLLMQVAMGAVLGAWR
jgi:hypothetical protein